MNTTGGDSYDGLSSRFVASGALRAFLLDCFEVDRHRLFLGHVDRVTADLAALPPDATFDVFCTYLEVRGHFAMGFDVGVTGRLAARVGRREFFSRFAARFGGYVLHGDAEPYGLWTVTLEDGGHLLAELDEEGDRYELVAATAPIPGLPHLRIDERLGEPLR